MKPGERVRLLKQLAERLSEEDGSHLDLYLRTFGFRSDVRYSRTEYQYALDMLEEGRDADLLALHEDLFGFSGHPGDEVETVDLWVAGRFRLFLTHVSAEKVFCSSLKSALESYGIDAFVAHEDIEPTREWLEEIERALASCDALVAVLHDGFKESDWTDQEVGFCHSRRVLIVSVRLDLDPYGFISRYQAVKGRGKQPFEIARELYQILSEHQKTSAPMAEALVTHFEESGSFDSAKNRVSLLKAVKAWTPALLRRLEEAEQKNDQISDAWGVPGQVREILKGEGCSAEQPADELPF